MSHNAIENAVTFTGKAAYSISAYSPPPGRSGCQARAGLVAEALNMQGSAWGYGMAGVTR